MNQAIQTILRTFNDLLTAGIAITAFSLLLYALSFNLRDRVARSFALIMLCVVVVFAAETMSSVSGTNEQLEFWMQLQWLGIIFIPATYLHFSDAILSTTGRPSRGRRRLAVRLVYLLSIVFLVTLVLNLLIGELVPSAQPVPHLERTGLTWVFSLYYIIVVVISWLNLWRAYRRTKTSASQRRMIYLLAGSLAPALGSYPYLLFGFGFAARHPLIFWLAVILSNLLVTILLVLMAYSVAFFGVPWPDRVIKRRLLKWIMRGPVTASSTLALTTLVRRVGLMLGVDLSPVLPAVMVASIVAMEHLITFLAPIWEHWLFRGRERSEVELLESLGDRLLTVGDLKQFLEAILAGVCDRLQTTKAFIGTFGPQGLDLLITVGGDNPLSDQDASTELLQVMTNDGLQGDFFSWGEFLVIPLTEPDRTRTGQEQDNGGMLGLLGVSHAPDQTLDEEQRQALSILIDRAVIALRDRRRQQQAFNSLEALTPQMEMIQRLRAAARYDGTEVLSTSDEQIEDSTLTQWVRDALTHYWGGPKLTQSPLLNLRVVQRSLDEYDENPTNTLRAVLRQAIDQVRPEGERRFTAEWILYNILELKFLEGRKVRDVAMRLAMSEADLYRKQRLAIEAVANAIVSMEQQARSTDLPSGQDGIGVSQGDIPVMRDDTGLQLYQDEIKARANTSIDRKRGKLNGE